MRASSFCVLLSLALTACSTTPSQPPAPTVTLSERDTCRLLASALRYWLIKHPVSAHTPCYVFIQDRADRRLPSFSRELPGYRLIVRYGSAGTQPPRPYYEL